MTLIISVVSPWGIWISSDHRFTDYDSKKIISDDTPKYIPVICTDGSAIILYSGVGILYGVTITKWIRGILRVEQRPVEEMLDFLLQKSNEVLAPELYTKQIAHDFEIGSFISGSPRLVILNNYSYSVQNSTFQVSEKFKGTGKIIDSSTLVCLSGTDAALSEEDRQTLLNMVRNKPRKPVEFHNLLAKYNRIASNDKRYGSYISPGCITTYLPPEGMPVSSIRHSSGGSQDPQIEHPIVLGGIDLTDFITPFLERIYNLKTKGKSADVDSRKLDLAAQEGVEPIDYISIAKNKAKR